MEIETMEDWCIPSLNDDEELEPSAEELESMLQILENGSQQSIELQWKCPGRRLPSPAMPADDIDQIDDSAEKEAPKNKEFDFMDEVAAPTMRVRGQNATPKGSAKKKTANFAGVMDAMKKHGRLSNPMAGASSGGSSSATQSPNKTASDPNSTS